MLAAHARLTIGITILADLLEPSMISVLAGFFNIEESSINGLLKIDQSKIKRLIGDLSKMKTSEMDFSNLTNGIEHLEEMYKEFNSLPPISTDNEDVRAPSYKKIIELNEFPETKQDELEQLGKYSGAVTTLKNNVDLYPTYMNCTISPNVDKNAAATAFQNFSTLMNIILEPWENFKNLEQEDFTTVFKSVNKKLEVYKKVDLTRVSATQVGTGVAISPFFSNVLSYLESSHAIKFIEKLTNADKNTLNDLRKWTGAFPDELLKIEDLKRDINETFLKETLTEDNSPLDALLKTLQPLFDSDSVIKTFWTALETYDYSKIADTIKNLDSLLKLLIESGSSSQDFTNSLSTVRRIVEYAKLINTSNPQVTNFENGYIDILNALGNLSSLKSAVKEYRGSDEFTNAASSSVSGYHSRVRSMDKSNCYFVIKNDNFDNADKHFPKVVEKLKKFNQEAMELKALISKIPMWQETTENLEMYIDETFGPFKDKINTSQQDLSKVKGGIGFVNLHKTMFATGETTVDLNELQKIKTTGVNNVQKRLDGLSDLKTQSLYKEVIRFRKNFRLREKLISGSILFRDMSRLIKESEVFDKLAETGNALCLKVVNTSSEDVPRNEFLKKLDVLNTTTHRIKDLLAHALKLKKRYTDVSNTDLLHARFLVDNLVNLPNPEYKVEDWTKFVDILNGTNMATASTEISEFSEAIESTFDLDFTAHQTEIIGTYWNLRALLRLHRSLVAIDHVS